MTPNKTNPNRDTRARFKLLIKEHPDLPPGKLASRLGVSTARVRDIAKDAKRRWIVTGRWGKA